MSKRLSPKADHSSGGFVDFVGKGTEAIKEAVEKDNANEINQALPLYTQGISLFVTGIKYEKNPKMVKILREKVAKYLKRAEEIKTALDKPKENKGTKDKEKEKEKEKENENEEDEEVRQMKKSLSEAIVIEKPNVKWEDVAGLDLAKQLLKEAVIFPIRFPQLFVGKRKPWSGILLYGPPGTGKSYLAKAVATEANNSTFFSVSSSDLVSKYVGESEKLVRNLFGLARQSKPSIIFIDEIDALASARSENESDHTRRLKTEFLVQIDGVGKDSKGVLTLGATNCPWDLDPALRRRFQKRIYIPLPEKEPRRLMFKIHVGKTPNSLTDFDYEILAKKTEGFSGSDISGVVQDALMEPIRVLLDATHFKKIPNPNSPSDYLLIPCSPGDIDAIEKTLSEISPEEQMKVRAEDLKIEHFIRVLHNSKPSVGVNEIQRHITWTKEYGQEG